eukprot:1257190-Amphidinium_carterae.1
MEPARILIDKFAAMSDDHIVSYVVLPECISHEDELSGAKKSRNSADNTLTEVHASSAKEADVSSDLRLLVKELTRVPPPRYQKITLNQLARADMEAWRLVSSRCTSGMQPN